MLGLLLPLAPYTAQQKILLGYKLDINRMGVGDWEALPRIGLGLARKIVTYQKEFGPFKNPEDLRNVRGFGEKTLILVRPYLGLSTSKK